MIKKLTITVLCLLLTSAFSFAADVNMKPGEWEITTTIEMPGAPMDMPPFSHTQCITKKDIVPQNAQSQNKDDCKIKKSEIKGNTVTWEMECKGENGNTSGKGKIVYAGTSFKGEMIVTMPGNMTMKNAMTGKRIGDCKK